MSFFYGFLIFICTSYFEVLCSLTIEFLAFSTANVFNIILFSGKHMLPSDPVYLLSLFLILDFEVPGGALCFSLLAQGAGLFGIEEAACSVGTGLTNAGGCGRSRAILVPMASNSFRGFFRFEDQVLTSL